jgi:hypothetical protein
VSDELHVEVQWASDGYATHTAMPTVADLLAQGWHIVGPDPRYPHSILMERDRDE